MTIRTGKEEYTARVAWVSERTPDELVLEIVSDKRISEIAADIEGNETITKHGNTGEETLMKGYTELRSISRDERTGAVYAKLERP